MIKCNPIMVKEAPNHFEMILFCLILTNPIAAKITANDNSIMALKKPKGLRLFKSIGIPPMRVMSNHLDM
jgi:hypothetical protein